MLQDLAAAVAALPTRLEWNARIADLRRELRQAFAPRKPKPAATRISAGPRTWHAGRRALA